MNYYLYCLRRFARLILLLWIVFRIAPLAAQDRAARLDFQVRKATLDTFVRQLEDSTGFSFIYGEKVQLRQPVTLDVRQKTIEEILQYAFGQEAITFKISGTHILLGERPVSRKYTVSGYIVRNADWCKYFGIQLSCRDFDEPFRVLQLDLAGRRDWTFLFVFRI